MSDPGKQRKAASPVARFFGGLLMALGGLLAGLAGLCTLALSPMTIGPIFSDGEFGLLVMALVFGGVPIAIGLGVFFAGRGLYRHGELP